MWCTGAPGRIDRNAYTNKPNHCLRLFVVYKLVSYAPQSLSAPPPWAFNDGDARIPRLT